jgi:predicted nucleotidyltransferase
MNEYYRPLVEIDTVNDSSNSDDSSESVREYRHYLPNSIINKNLERVKRMAQHDTQLPEYSNLSKLTNAPSLIMSIKAHDSVSRKAMITVLKQLRMLEKEEDITIYYAVETGSRAHGLHSNDSDYDVRFVYSHNDIVYMSEQMRSYANKSNSLNGDIHSEGIHIDYQGWSLDKAIQFLHKRNITIVELIESPIIYLDRREFQEKFRTTLYLMNSDKIAKSMYYHYVGMADRNYKKYICNANEHQFGKLIDIDDYDLIKIDDYYTHNIADETQPLLPKTFHLMQYKKYLTVIRPILQAMYVYTSRYDSHLSPGLEDLLPKTIANFEELLEYYEHKIGIKNLSNSDSTDSTDSTCNDDAECDITTDSDSLTDMSEQLMSDSDDCNRMICVDGDDDHTHTWKDTKEYCVTDEDEESSSDNIPIFNEELQSTLPHKYSDLMMDSEARKELEIVINSKRISSAYEGPRLIALDAWIIWIMYVLPGGAPCNFQPDFTPILVKGDLDPIALTRLYKNIAL